MQLVLLIHWQLFTLGSQGDWKSGGNWFASKFLHVFACLSDFVYIECYFLPVRFLYDLITVCIYMT